MSKAATFCIVCAESDLVRWKRKTPRKAGLSDALHTEVQAFLLRVPDSIIPTIHICHPLAGANCGERQPQPVGRRCGLEYNVLLVARRDVVFGLRCFLW